MEKKDHPLLPWAREVLKAEGRMGTIILMAWWCTQGRHLHSPEEREARTEALSLALQEEANKEMAGLL